MSEQDWNDEARNDLRESLRSAIVGQVRLANLSQEDMRDYCREVYIDDECPESERGTFNSFVAEELDRVTKQHKAGMYLWDVETDCDRLDRVESALRERGILLWQVSPCCDTCSGAELPDRIDVIESRFPGFRDRVRGYAFFIDQNMPEMLSDNTSISVYLAYGWFSEDDSEVAPEVYEQNALGIAGEVRDCLSDEGFEPDWDGSFNRKIGLSLNWQRRTMLE